MANASAVAASVVMVGRSSRTPSVSIGCPYMSLIRDSAGEHWRMLLFDPSVLRASSFSFGSGVYLAALKTPASPFLNCISASHRVGVRSASNGVRRAVRHSGLRKHPAKKALNCLKSSPQISNCIRLKNRKPHTEKTIRCKLER